MGILRLGSTTLGLALSVASVCAQGPTSLEYSLSNPGARAMGFGGAFIGLADDATAAFTNPAGLVLLQRPELSLEGRSWSYATPFTLGGRALGPPTGIGIDTTADLRFGSSAQDLTGISFLSFVYPVQGWSLAFYRHQLANFEASAATNGLFAEVPGLGTERFEDALVTTDLDLVTYGFSAAYQLSDALSIGFGLAYVDGNARIHQQSYFPDDFSLEGFFGPNSYLPERLIGGSDIVVDQSAWILSTGFLWRISERLSLGGVYREGPEYQATIIETAGPAFDPSVPPGTTRLSETPFAFPDVYGLGLATRSKGKSLTFTLDWVLVKHSATLDSLNRELFDNLPLVDNANELHAGIEYVFVNANPIVALRCGGWLDPDHRLRADPDEAPVFDRALFRGGSDTIHLAAGLGLVFPKFQLDFGIDFSKYVDTVAISVIYPF